MAIHRNGVVSHVGQVLGHGHTAWNDSMHIESFHAQVWDATTGQPKDVFYRDDFGNTGHFEVDATDDVLQAYAAYAAKVDAERTAYLAKLDFDRLERGKVVSVNRGRKVAKGTIGQIFWIGNNGYGESVGIIALDGMKHFTASSNVDVVSASPEQAATLSTLQAESKAKWQAENPIQHKPATTYHGGHKARQYRNYSGWRTRAY